MARPRPSGGVPVLTALLLVSALSLLPGIATAQERTGASVVVGPNETVEGDLEAVAGSVVVRGRVTGDVNAFAGSVRIDGSVGGDVSAVGGSITIGQRATIGGNVNAAGESVLIAGQVAGNVDTTAETTTLAATANIGGNLTYDGTLDRVEGAVVGGTISQGDLGGDDTDPSPFPDWGLVLYGVLVTLVLGALFLLVFPDFSRAVASRATDSALRSGAAGLLVLIGIPVALVLIALTVVGIPLSVLGIFLFIAFVWAGAVYGRYAIGTWLSGLVDIENRWVDLLLGVLVVAALKRIPFLSGLIELLVVLLGLGALSLTVVDRYRHGRRSEPAIGTEAGDESVSGD